MTHSYSLRISKWRQNLGLFLRGRWGLVVKLCTARCATDGMTGMMHGLAAIVPNRKLATDMPLAAVIITSGEGVEKTLACFPQRGDVELITTDNSKAAVNTAISNARAPYIVCIAAGDTVTPSYIDKVLLLQETFATPTIVIPSANNRNYHAFNLHEMLHDNYTAPVSMFRRTDWHAAGGYSETVPALLADWDFFIRLAKQGVKSHVLSEQLYNPAGATVYTDADRTALRTLHPELLEYGYCAGIMARWNFIYHDDAFLNIAARVIAPKSRTVLFMFNAPVLGGAERIIEQISQHLKTNGWHVIIVTVMPPPSGYGSRENVFSEIADEYFNLSALLPQFYWGAFLRFLVGSRKVETLFAATVMFFYSQLAELRAAFPSLRMIDFPFVPEEGALQYSRLHKDFIDWRVIESQAGAGIIAAAGVKADKVAVIANGVDLQTFSPILRTKEFRRGFRQGDIDPLLIGFCARLSPEKNIEGLLRICDHFKSNPNVRFIIAGDGPMAPLVQHVARQLANITYLGSIKNSALVLANIDVLLLPSISEGRPNVMLEALACGTPVLGSTASAIPEVLIQGETGWTYHAADTTGFCSRIEDILANKAQLAPMRDKARLYAEQNLDRKGMVEAFAALIGGEYKKA